MKTEKKKILSDKDFTQIFWKLSSGFSEERDAACYELLGYLFETNDHLCEKMAEQRADNVGLADRLQYTLERLFKGLAGIKPESKHGFSLALALLLEKLHKNQVRSAFTTAEKCLLEMKVDSKMEASSKKAGACLLVLVATRSGAFAKLRPNQRCRIIDAVSQLLDGGQHDRSLADLAAFALMGAIEQLSTDEFNSHLFEKLSTKLSSGWDSLDVNGLMLLLCCHQHQKEAVGRNYLKTHYDTKHLISQANLDHFLRICLSSVNDSNDCLSSCRLHPGVELLLNSLLTKSPSLLAEFAASIVRATLTDPDLPPARKALGLAVLVWISNCPVESFGESSANSKAECLAECLASVEVCCQLRSHAASRKSLLHSFACKLLASNQLLPSSTDGHAILVAVANRLLGADCLFDDGLSAECRVLRADTMARLPVDLLDDCASRIEAELSSGSCPTASNQKQAEAIVQSRRAAFGLQTLRLLASGSRALLADRPKSCARMLLCLADLFLPGQPVARDASATDARSAFCRALDSVSAAALSGGSAYRRGYRRCLRQLGSGLIDRLKPALSKKSAVLKSLTMGLELLSSNSDPADQLSDGVCGGIDWCFALAFLHLGFHLLPGASDSNAGSKGNADSVTGGGIDEASVDEASALALIADLTECHRRSGFGSDEARQQVASAGEQQPKWPDVLLDSFVGLLGASRSRLLRSVASLVARQVAPLVTPEGVGALTQQLLEGDVEEENEEIDEEGDSESGEDEAMDTAEYEKEDNEESEISLSEPSESEDETGNGVDPEFRRTCKSALGEAACPSDAEADIDLSDLSDSAMEKVDEALSLAFRSQLGPAANRRGQRAVNLERRRRRLQAKLRLLDVAEPLLLTGSSSCRGSVAACLARLALLAVGGGGSFWSASPAGERDQLRARCLTLLKRGGAAAAGAVVKDAAADKAADDEIAKAVEAALAANLRSPLPARMADTAADILSALLRIRPGPAESFLARALAHQLSPSPAVAAARRFRLGGLALWQRVCSERPGLLAGLRQRLLDLLMTNGEASTPVNGEGDSGDVGLKSHDRAAIVSLATCVVKGDISNKEADNGEESFVRRLAEWTFNRLEAETGPAGVTSAHLLAALLQLAAALLRQLRSRIAHCQKAGQVPAPASLPSLSPELLADRLRAMRSGSRSRDLRRGLQACLAELAGFSKLCSIGAPALKKQKQTDKKNSQKAKRPVEADVEEPTEPVRSKKRRLVVSHERDEQAKTDDR